MCVEDDDRAGKGAGSEQGSEPHFRKGRVGALGQYGQMGWGPPSLERALGGVPFLGAHSGLGWGVVHVLAVFKGCCKLVSLGSPVGYRNSLSSNAHSQWHVPAPGQLSILAMT